MNKNPETPAMRPAEKFEVSDTKLKHGVQINFAKAQIVVLYQDLSGLREFHRILSDQKWCRLMLPLRTPSGDLVFELHPHTENLAFSVSGQTWNLTEKHVYMHITEQLRKLIILLGDSPMTPLNPVTSTDTKKLQRDDLFLLGLDHCFSIYISTASGGEYYYQIGLKGLGTLLRILVGLDTDGTDLRYATNSSTVRTIEVEDDFKNRRVTVRIEYVNGTRRFFALSYSGVRILAERAWVWMSAPLVIGYGMAVDMGMIKSAINVRYDCDNITKHVDPVQVNPATPVPKLTEICQFLINHPEHHPFVLGMLQESAKTRKSTETSKP